MAKRVKDKWRTKSWYEIHAPEMFNNTVLGETPAEDAGGLQNRVIEVTVQDLIGDFSRMHIKVQFGVDRVAGSKVSTKYLGHNMTSDYIRRLTRRKRSRIDGTFDVKTKDGALIRVKPMAITDRRIQSSKQTAIRKVMHRVIYERASGSKTGDFVKAMIMGDLARDIANACKAVQPIFRIEVRKSELLQSPAAVEEEVVEKAKEPEEAPAEEAPEEEAAEEAEEKAPAA